MGKRASTAPSWFRDWVPDRRAAASTMTQAADDEPADGDDDQARQPLLGTPCKKSPGFERLAGGVSAVCGSTVRTSLRVQPADCRECSDVRWFDSGVNADAIVHGHLVGRAPYGHLRGGLRGAGGPLHQHCQHVRPLGGGTAFRWR